MTVFNKLGEIKNMKYISLISIFVLACSTQAQDLYIASQLKAWPTLSLQSHIAPIKKDLIVFEDTDFKAIDKRIASKSKGLIPSGKWQRFDKMVLVNNPEVHWRATMSAVSGSHVSGFSQGIGMTTMLIKDELFLNAEIEHLQFDYKNKHYQKHFGGDKYRVNSTLSWFPTDDISMHLGISHLFDK
jgi:hypothetical protein